MSLIACAGFTGLNVAAAHTSFDRYSLVKQYWSSVFYILDFVPVCHPTFFPSYIAGTNAFVGLTPTVNACAASSAASFLSYAGASHVRCRFGRLCSAVLNFARNDPGSPSASSTSSSSCAIAFYCPFQLIPLETLRFATK